jgi:uncharacterized protein YwqG
MLSFFYDTDPEHGVWGFDPKHRSGWSVLYSPPDVDLQVVSFPEDLPREARFAEVPLHPHEELTFAPCDSYGVDRLGMPLEQKYVLEDIDALDHDPPIHRLLGNPDPIQADMQLECQLASSGIYLGDASGHRDPRHKELEPGAAEWRLLLQIDSDDAAGMMWGDVGRIYWWIRERDLRQRDFTRCWLILQCS